MSARAFLKSGARILAHYSGVAGGLSLRYGGSGVIFMLHSTIADSDSNLEDIRCPVASLERMLSWLRDNGVRIVSLDEALNRLSEPPCDKFCVFTFDDGYADNLIHALPVMERFGAPFVVYVATGMMTGEIDAWWLGLAALIRRHDRVELPDLKCRFDCPDHASKRRAYANIAAMVHANYDALEAVRAAIARRGINCGVLARQQGLTPEQLRQLALNPLVTIAAHTERHPNLMRTSTLDVRREMLEGRRVLEDILQREVVHFAYPYGNAKACGQREAQIAQAVGFRTAVTTRHGTLFPEHLDNPFALPREPLSGADTPITLRCKLSGLNRAFQSALGDPVARM